MKKTRLLVLMLALALLVCGAIGITASAETEPTLTLKKNVSFVDTPSLVFAVEGVEAEADVELRVYASAEATEYYTATAIEGGVVIDEVEYPAFYLAGIYPKDIANEVYVKAVSEDKESAMLRYSILEFALEGIDTYKGVNDELAAFYQNIIDYSSGIQKYIGDTDTNVADYNYVKVQDGTIGGYSTAVLADGEYTVTFTGSAPAGLTHIGWTVGATEFTGNTVTISESCTVTPKYQASVVTLQPGETFDDGRVVDAADGYIKNSSGTKTKIRYYKTNSGTVGLQSGDAIEIVNDPANSGNKVLKFTDGSTSNYTSVHIDASPDRVEYSADNKDNKGVKTTFETLLYIEEYPDVSFTNNQTVAQPMFTTGGRSTALSFNITYSTEEEQFYFALTTAGTGAALTETFTKSTYFNANEWVAIRFEWYQYDLRAEEKAIIKLYINNVHAADITPPTSMLTAKGESGESLYGTNDVDHMMWKGLSSSKAVMYFDNLSMYDAYIDQTIVETPAE